jgi:hypothetical protein
MFQCTFNNMMLGAYRPGRAQTIERASSQPDERATLIHERTHEYLTTQSTTGLAAIVCGTRKANHDLTVLPGPDGRRAALDLPYLRFFKSATAWTQEGAATGCEAIHWQDLTQRDKDDLLSRRPDTYALAARQFYQLLDPLSAVVMSVHPHFAVSINSALISATALGILSPPVPPGYYRAAAEGKSDGFQLPIQEIPKRAKAVFGVMPHALKTGLAPLLDDLFHSVEKKLHNLPDSLAEIFPGDDNASLRNALASQSADPVLRATLSVTVADLPQFKERIVSKMVDIAGIEPGNPDLSELEKLGVISSVRPKRAFWTDRGRRTEARRPVKYKPVRGILWELAEFLTQDQAYLVLPEIVGPFLGGVALLLLHVFDHDAQHLASLLSEVNQQEFATAKELCGLSLQRLVASPFITSARCFGVVVPFLYGVTPLAAIIQDLPAVEIPHVGVDGDQLENETLIGIWEGDGLIRQLLSNGKTTWQVIAAPFSETAPLHNILDRCYTWVLANGGNAMAVWQHHNQET